MNDPSMNDLTCPRIAIIGGTGNLGLALARRWAQAGYAIFIGSRTADRAMAAAEKLTAAVGGDVRGMDYAAAADAADIVVVTVPAEFQVATLLQIQAQVIGKLLIDTTVPLVPPKVMRVQMPPEGSAAMRAQLTLGDSVTVVSAFHNVAAHRLATDESVECDVLIFGDKKDARERVVELAKAAGLRGLHAGSLANSTAAESLTSVLIFMNKHYAADGAGVRLTGI